MPIDCFLNSACVFEISLRTSEHHSELWQAIFPKYCWLTDGNSSQNYEPRWTTLVGGFNPSEKYESQLGWWNSQYMESHKNSCSKPPTRTVKPPGQPEWISDPSIPFIKAPNISPWGTPWSESLVPPCRYGNSCETLGVGLWFNTGCPRRRINSWLLSTTLTLCVVDLFWIGLWKKAQMGILGSKFLGVAAGMHSQETYHFIHYFYNFLKKAINNNK